MMDHMRPVGGQQRSGGTEQRTTSMKHTSSLLVARVVVSGMAVTLRTRVSQPLHSCTARTELR